MRKPSTIFFSKTFKNTSGSGQAKKDEDQIQQGKNLHPVKTLKLENCGEA